MKQLLSIILLGASISISACSAAQTDIDDQTIIAANTPNVKTTVNQQAEAIFAGGCFWCVESDYEKLPGVIEAISGYTGGRTTNPTYKQIGRGGTGHYEAVKVIYDPSVVSYSQLVEFFWIHVDPTDDGGQFCDRGHTYKTAIFVDAAQIDIAKASKETLQKSGRLKRPVVTPVLEATIFYDAEGYHQDYYKKNPVRYKYYRTGCRRDKRIKKIWGTH